MKNKFRNTESTIKAGDLILTEQPFAYVLSSKEKGIRCDNCLEKGKVLKCSGCQFVHYCGRSCQRDAWADHKWECANLKRVSPKVIPDAARMLAKIINKLNRGDGHSYRAFYSATSFRMWKDLMSHYPDLKADTKRMEHFTSLCGVLFEFLKDLSLPNNVELMGLYGRMIINSFTILDNDMNSIGTAVYLASSIVDHSCNPNAVATFDGKTINIRALTDMPYLDWNQIRISYIDLMKTPYERQTELLENYYFLCQCDRCMDESQMKIVHAAKCLNSECDSPVSIPWKEDCLLVRRPEERLENGHTMNGNCDIVNGLPRGDDSVRCEECGTKFTVQHVELFVKTMEFTELHLQNMKDVDVCNYCLERQEGVLHPMNVMHAQTLDHAFDALILVQLWEKACDYAERLIPCFRFYYGDRHPLLGLLYLKYGKILLYRMDLQKSLQQLKYAEKILRITHGDKHPLYREYLLPLLGQAMIESS
ncbi:histone-lysine N-methyltransferase SMYD3 isoform X2 [Achroia grisella]|uniref:histone-lysine N-methyltransferase SMYD3 isoform X2 n=1 Tax=Achroia grisella TaxID=688607 RepID=UPI0027D2A940|nr:histone-lysine N-methyltransferase SMYD3 isoform X2 [Achroia grisella]